MGERVGAIERWVEEQRARGCTADAVVDALVRAGHARDQARQVVERAFAPAPAAARSPVPPATGALTAAAAAPGLRPWATGTGMPNAVRIGEREVQVLFGLVAPRVLLFGNLLAPDECAALIEASRHKILPSLVVDPKTGGFHADAVRSSRGTFFRHAETTLVANLERRIEALFGFRIAQQEALQILHYGVGGAYEPHYDYFDPASPGSHVPMATGGQRIATLVMYLNDVEAGGATVFPTLGLEVKPRRGHALYFESRDAAGQLDVRTLHGGAPVGAGEKWIATKWIRERDVI